MSSPAVIGHAISEPTTDVAKLDRPWQKAGTVLVRKTNGEELVRKLAR